MSQSRWAVAALTAVITACGNPLERGTGDAVESTVQALENGTCSHALTVTGPPLVATCSACAGTVCARDPYCCTTYWDSICVNEANSWCAAPTVTTVLAATFEAPYTGSFLYQPVSSDWLYAGSGVQGASFEGAWVPAPEGVQQGFLQSGGSLSRTVGLTGGSHVLSFRARRRTSQGGSLTSPLEVRLNGGFVGSAVPSNTAAFSLFQVVVSGSGNQNLSIVNVAGGATVLIDDVKIVNSTTGAQLLSSTFESPNAGGSFIYQPASADFFYTGAGVQRSAFVNGGWLLAAEGAQFGFFQSGASMERVVAFTASGTHTLTLKIARSSQLGGSMTSPLQVTIDGAPVASFVTSNGFFTTVSASFSVNAGNRSLKLTNTAGAALTFIDDLKLTR